MRTILVTGGCGFIGSNFIRYALQHHDGDVVNLDKLTYAGNPANLEDVAHDPWYHFELGNVACDGDVDRVFRHYNPDVVVNFAAESHVDRSIVSAAPFVETNVKGTQTLLDAARRYGVVRYVQVSTDEVYGSLGPDDKPFTEYSPVQPNSPYSASKAAADMFVRAYYETYGLPTVITRCSNNYGPYQFPEKLIPLAIMRLCDHKKVPVYGDGLQVRDWLHVDDHVRGIWMALHRGESGRVYNFGGGCEVTNVDLVKQLCRFLVKPANSIEYVKDRLGHDRRYAVDYTRARHELGWTPEVAFYAGLEETVRWYLDNYDWVTGVQTNEYLHYYERQYGKAVAA